jgi:hypothetical protein
LTTVGTHYGLPIGTCLLMNESLVTRARNTCADVFMSDPKFEHMMFIDADIGFEAKSVLELLVLQIQNPDYDIIGAPYKVKSIAQDRYAFQMTSKNDATNLALSMPQDVTEPIEVSGIATGFMMIRRSVFERFKEAFGDYSYTVDTITEGSPSFAPALGKRIMMYFQAEIDKASGHYLSEDYWFSRRCEEIGIRTWLCPWMHLRHAGVHLFE